MEHPTLVPGAEPYFLPGGPSACLLIHGFTCSPEETRLLGEDLNQLGYTVLGLRLAGHGSHPRDLARVRAENWLGDIADGISLLQGICQEVFLIGQSLGGCLALASAAAIPSAGAVAISTPYPPQRTSIQRLLGSLAWVFQPTTKKAGPQPHPTLGIRREAGYPAYAEFPTRVLQELLKAQEIMAERLGAVEAPVLLLQSRDDPSNLPEEPPRILEELGCQRKELVWLDGYGHNLLYRPDREEVLQIISDFLSAAS